MKHPIPSAAAFALMAFASAADDSTMEVSGCRLKLPEGWRTASQDQVELANKLLVGILSRDRVAEFSIAAAFVAPGTRFLEVVGGTGGCGGMVIQLKGGATPEELLLYGQKGLHKVGEELRIGRQSVGFSLDPRAARRVIAPVWSDSADAAVAVFPGVTNSGKPMDVVGYLLPTRQGGLLVGCNLAGPDREAMRRQMDAMVKARTMNPEQTVPAEFLTAYRKLVDEAAAEAARRNRLIDLEAEWSRLQQAAKDKTSKENDPAAGCSILEQSRGLLKELAAAEPASSLRWTAHEIETLEEMASWKWRCGLPEKGWELLQEGNRMLDAVPAQERMPAMWNAASKLHGRMAEFALNLHKDAVAARDFRQKAFEARMKTGWALDSTDNTRWTAEMQTLLAAACLAARDLPGAVRNASEAADGLANLVAANSAAGSGAAALESLGRTARVLASCGETAAAVRFIVVQLDAVAALAGQPDIGAGPQVALLRCERDAINFLLANSSPDGPWPGDIARRMTDRATAKANSPDWSEECGRIVAETTAQFAVTPEVWLAESLELQRKARNPAYTEGAGPRGFPKRSPEAAPVQIDLTGFYNAILDRHWQSRNENYHLGNVPKGLQRLDGVTFDVRGVVQLFGQGRDRAMVWPGAVRDIPVGQKFRRLHVLHATGWSEPDAGVKVASIRLNFAAGGTQEFPILYGTDVRDWNAAGEAGLATSSASIAWTGTGGGGQKLRLFHRVYENPAPDKSVRSLDLISGGQVAALIIVALTAEP